MISMIKSIVNNSNKKNKNKDNNLAQNDIETFETRQQTVSDVNLLSNEIGRKFNDNSIEHAITGDSNVESTISTFHQLSIGPGIIGYNNSTIAENKIVDDPYKRKLLDQVNSLQCLFTWKLNSLKEQDIIRRIKNKYGDLNLDISIPEFTFARFIGNLIISYELYLNGDKDASEIKILEIGKWLEHLDKGTDEFYLSINIGLKHIKMSNFIHMQLPANDTRGFKQLFEEIVLFEDMNKKAKAAVYAIHAAILIEYGEHLNCFKNACEYAKMACVLDPEISDWFHIYLLVLIAQRYFVYTSEYTSDKSVLLANQLYPVENEIRYTVQNAVTSSGIKSTRYINSLVLAALNQFFANEFQVESDRVPALKKKFNEKSIESNFEEDMKILVKKHKTSKDAAPYLTVLVSKYKHDRWKIWAQICSCTILFKNNFKDGVVQFLSLIEESKMSPSELMRHKSLFINNPKPFNLSELVRSEIRFATSNNFNGTIKDLLFYYKTFLKIEEVYIPKMKVGIPSLKTTLISNLLTTSKCSSTRTTSVDKTNLSIDEGISSSISTCSNASYQDEYDKSNKGSDIDKSEDKIIKRKNKIRKRRKKNVENTGLRLFTNGSKLDQKNDTPEKHLKTESVFLKSEIEMKSKIQLNEKYFMDFFMSSTIPFGNVCSNKSYPGLAENVRPLQMQTEMFNLQQQNNLQNISIQNFVYFNFLHANQFSTSIPIPSLLDLKLDLHFQSKIGANFNSINMGSMKIDISLSKLPRFSTSQNDYKQSLKCILLNYPNSFKIYTDASKIQNNVGIAMVSDKDTYTYKLSPEYTSCDAEAVAILLALDYALAQNYIDYLILTDSLSILTCIENKNTSSDVINSILHLINANQLKGNKINFIWVPGHNSIEGNEIADRLARIVATSPSAVTYSHNSFAQAKLK